LALVDRGLPLFFGINDPGNCDTVGTSFDSGDVRGSDLMKLIGGHT